MDTMHPNDYRVTEVARRQYAATILSKLQSSSLEESVDLLYRVLSQERSKTWLRAAKTLQYYAPGTTTSPTPNQMEHYEDFQRRLRDYDEDRRRASTYSELVKILHERVELEEPKLLEISST